jgi:hypothetical protein
MGDRTGAYRVLLGRPKEWRPLGSPRLRWKENIVMNLQEVGWRSMDWIDVAQDRDRWGGSCDCCNEPSGSIKCRELLG